MIHINRVHYRDAKDKIDELTKKHFQECPIPGIEDEFDLHHDLYNLIEEMRTYLSLVLQDDDKIVGYMSFFISHMPHHKNKKQAHVDALYIDPKYRGKSYFKKLFKTGENILKREFNVSYVWFSFSVESNLIPLVERIGYQVSEFNCVKKL